MIKLKDIRMKHLFPVLGVSMLSFSQLDAQILDASGNVDFSAVASVLYKGQGNGVGTETVSGDGSSVTLVGNLWRAYQIPTYTITSDTILEFTINAADIGEFIGVSLDSDDYATNAPALFVAGGSQYSSSFGAVSFQLQPRYLSGDGAVTYTVSVANYISGDVNYIGIFADDDSVPETADVTISNVRLYESGSTPPPPDDPTPPSSDDPPPPETNEGDLLVTGIARIDGGLDLVGNGLAVYATESDYDTGEDPVAEIKTDGTIKSRIASGDISMGSFTAE